MRISGFTLVRNGVEFDYPFLESLTSLLAVVDELVINVGQGTDATLEEVQRWATAHQAPEKRIHVFESNWHLDDPEKKKAGRILSEQTNLALERCSSDWCLYLQADEVLHEADAKGLKARILQAARTPEVEALYFDYTHFYGSYDVIQYSRSTYRREVRALRKSSGAQSIGDAQSFRKPDGSKLKACAAHARVFHYGWVRTPEAMREKTFFMDQLYHGDPSEADICSRTPHTGDNYRYKRIWGLKPFTGTHPAVMMHRINNQGWHWDLKASQWVFSIRDCKRVLLDTFEALTGIRLFEYRSFRICDL
jgi:hypothetical protein